MKERKYAPRITVELPLNLVEWLQALPYGTKKHLFTALVDDVKKACDKLDSTGKPLKNRILSALIERQLELNDISNIGKVKDDAIRPTP